MRVLKEIDLKPLHGKNYSNFLLEAFESMGFDLQRKEFLGQIVDYFMIVLLQ